jgi:hypothetical protein
LRLRVDWHATPEDHVDFHHMPVSIGDLPVMLSPTGILGCWRSWRRHLFMIQKSFTLFQIMSIGAMDLTPLLCVVEASEGSPFLLIGVLFSAIVVSSTVLLISSFSGVDFPIIPSSWWSLASRLQKFSPGFRSFYAYIGNCEQIGYSFELLHRYLFHGFEIVDAISEGVNNLDVLDVWDVISDIAEMLDIIMETLIMLLLNDLEGLDGRWTLIGSLEVPGEHDTQLVPGVNGSFR